MISGREILEQLERGKIAIEGVEEDGRVTAIAAEDMFVGPNSLDLHMADELYAYAYHERVEVAVRRRLSGSQRFRCIDPLAPPPLLRQQKVEIARQYHHKNDPMMGKARDGLDRYAYVLRPGVLYLGRTWERTYCEGFVPQINGRSSLGRLGVFCHVTAGLGDDGFHGTWTLEFAVVEPVIIYPWPHRLSRMFQITFAPIVGERKPYSGRYQGQIATTPSFIAKK